MKIVLIGAGNVGYHLGQALHKAEEEIVQVFSRNPLKAQRLASLIGAKPVSDLDRIDPGAELYLISVHDDAIGEVARRISRHGAGDRLVAHTSGATSLNIFQGTGIDRGGVFYPLQTFSVEKSTDFKEIPFCIDAQRAGDLETLQALAGKLSTRVFHLNERQRSVTHVAAVFANNFTNYLYHIANSLLERENLNLELLMPLIRETVDKLEEGDPLEMQTGPASRDDEKTIQRHLSLLENMPEYREIYQLLSDSIKSAKTRNAS